jgi:hypothetical protein
LDKPLFARQGAFKLSSLTEPSIDLKKDQINEQIQLKKLKFLS